MEPYVSTIRAAALSAHEDQDACEAIDGCTWIDQGQGNCIPLDVSCEELRNEQVCQASPGCEWDADNEECAEA